METISRITRQRTAEGKRTVIPKPRPPAKPDGVVAGTSKKSDTLPSKSDHALARNGTKSNSRPPRPVSAMAGNSKQHNADSQQGIRGGARGYRGGATGRGRGGGRGGVRGGEKMGIGIGRGKGGLKPENRGKLDSDAKVKKRERNSSGTDSSDLFEPRKLRKRP